MCRSEPGYWTQATHNVTQEQRDEADEYVECVKKMHKDDPRTKDYQFRANERMGRIAETSGASVFHAVASPCQKYEKRGFLQKADLSTGWGIRWSGLAVPLLMMKSTNYVKRDDGSFDMKKLRKRQPLDEIEILASGTDQEIIFHGWLTMREISASYDVNSPFYSYRWKNWAVPAELLHRLPVYPRREGLPARHQRVSLFLETL